MDIGTIKTLLRPRDAAEITEWSPSRAWLAGGTWLFSDVQPGTDTLVDLGGLGWPELEPELGLFVARYEAQRFGSEAGRPGAGELRRCRRRLLRRWRRIRTPGRESAAGSWR